MKKPEWFGAICKDCYRPIFYQMRYNNRWKHYDGRVKHHAVVRELHR